MPSPSDGPAPARSDAERVYVAVTAAIVVLPFLAFLAFPPLGAAGWWLWGSLIHPADIVLALVLYAVTGLGVTIGFHRGLTHGGHRTVRPGDPPSPYRYGTQLRGQLRGLLDAHVGRLFRNGPTPAERYAPDLPADRDIRAVARAFPALCVLTLALPFAIGWAIGGTWVRALTAALWAGLVRIALLHHVTWSVNSRCHVLGKRPFRTRRHDRATNLWPLALLSFGESRHNLHHADPTSARHGVDRGQIDPSAAANRLLERLGWVHDVRRPTSDRLSGRRA
nr:fatty acid desaturase [Streptomyces caniscabiei]